jgi:hypothetical protein
MTKNSSCYGTTPYPILDTHLCLLKINFRKPLQDINMLSTRLKPKGIAKVKAFANGVFARRKLNLE